MKAHSEKDFEDNNMFLEKWKVIKILFLNTRLLEVDTDDDYGTLYIAEDDEDKHNYYDFGAPSKSGIGNSSSANQEVSDFCDSDVPGPAPEVEPPRPAPGSSYANTNLGTATSSLGRNPSSMDTSLNRMQFNYDQSFSNQVTSVDLNDNFNHDNQQVQPQQIPQIHLQPQVYCCQIFWNDLKKKLQEIALL